MYTALMMMKYQNVSYTLNIVSKTVVYVLLSAIYAFLGEASQERGRWRTAGAYRDPSPQMGSQECFAFSHFAPPGILCCASVARE